MLYFPIRFILTCLIFLCPWSVMPESTKMLISLFFCRTVVSFFVCFAVFSLWILMQKTDVWDVDCVLACKAEVIILHCGMEFYCSPCYFTPLLGGKRIIKQEEKKIKQEEIKHRRETSCWCKTWFITYFFSIVPLIFYPLGRGWRNLSKKKKS